jgi:hypothetical protein
MIMNSTPIRIVKFTSVILSSLVLIACGGGSESGSKAAINGGLDCFAQGATVQNTTEGSGIAIFFNSIFYPSNSNTGTPWTFLMPSVLNLSGNPSYKFTSCSDKYAAIIDSVISQDRNKAGTLSDGANETYTTLRAAVSNSTAPFVGLDTFFFAANNLGLAPGPGTAIVTQGITSSAFRTALLSKCEGRVEGSNLNTTGVCPNATLMYNFLWRENGLLLNNGVSGVIGVVPSRGNPGLTWTRGYLLRTYSNFVNTTPFYTAIFDAGSSGTRLSFYQVTPSTSGGKATIVNLFTQAYDDEGINDFMSGQGSIDISELTPPALPRGCPRENNLGQNDVGPCVLQPLLDYLTSQLPSGVLKTQVKIELFATAGMRTEDQRNGGAFTTTQIAVFYDTMKNHVSSVGYTNVGEFKTINGNSEEGVWTWINLNDVYFNTFSTQGSCGNAPTGNFEVGGSSMQIAFPVSRPPNDTANVYNVNINGCSINVYSKTYLGLGGDDARKFMRALNY